MVKDRIRLLLWVFVLATVACAGCADWTPAGPTAHASTESADAPLAKMPMLSKHPDPNGFNVVVDSRVHGHGAERCSTNDVLAPFGDMKRVVEDLVHAATGEPWTGSLTVARPEPGAVAVKVRFEIGGCGGERGVIGCASRGGWHVVFVVRSDYRGCKLATPNARSTWAHEIGHVLGFGHAEEQDFLMHEFSNGTMLPTGREGEAMRRAFKAAGAWSALPARWIVDR